MQRPWYVTEDAWELRGGWTRERDLIRHARLRLCGMAVIVAVVAIFSLGIVNQPASPGASLQARGGLHNVK
jgi:hypothetical protein